MSDPTFRIFGAGTGDLAQRAPAPPWRSFARTGEPPPYVTDEAIVRAVNAALHLRRPLLVTGGPGTGKSALAREIARQLRAERFLKWPVNSKSTLADALYRYDAIGRLRDLNLQRGAGQDDAAAAREEAIGAYLALGPLGTALVPPRPVAGCQAIRVLLIDEIDKSDLDLPNDLLDVLEDGDFVLPELQRIAATRPKVTVGLDPGRKPPRPAGAPEDDAARDSIEIERGRVGVSADAYPFILITSNGERDFSPAFHRRCVHLDLPAPTGQKATDILASQLGKLDAGATAAIQALATELLTEAGPGGSRHSIDQVMNLGWLLVKGADPADEALLAELKAAVARRLDESGG